ncbi:hypothetical protein EIB75_00440 [Epilithonimonas vandammei]|uniref:Uncharacterized protein n=2 Tax=Epilithonimonas TaxID=2782229 RepID=A0A1H6L6Y1_9FLAO|nr:MULTISPECIES: hypothetical protein [Epilithonimonas]AZI53811.1 hypothetical protein EIB75_00440 [Epilithonimonas vandammei]SEH80182.1 hypothetical protein SAMN05421793_13221 [Epilithonimonas hominis]
MKKTFLKAALILSLVASTSAVVVSCSNNDDETTETIIDNSGINPNNFRGDITSNITLDPSKVYTINGKLSVKSGASLTIPAGTQIKVTSGYTKADGNFEVSYLIVETGAKIFINGTAAKPVVFEGTTHKPGHWGGIVVLGNAPSNRSAGGTSKSELGDLPYGGTNKTDNSGVINYVVIKDSGYKYNPEKEFNGLSLFGVGSGTKVSYVYVVDGADDAIEFFGGNVNADHLVLLGVGDDSFDWTEGWQGTAEYVYAARKKQYLNDLEPGNRGIEADTQDQDPNTTNGANGGISNPTIKNFTLIGNTKGAESQGLKIRAGSNGVFENIVVANFSTGLDFETDRTYNWFTSGNRITNIQFVNIPTKAKAKSPFPDAILTAFVEKDNNGAGAGVNLPDWAKGWTGLTSFTPADAGN